MIWPYGGQHERDARVCEFLQWPSLLCPPFSATLQSLPSIVDTPTVNPRTIVKPPRRYSLSNDGVAQIRSGRRASDAFAFDLQSTNSRYYATVYDRTDYRDFAVDPKATSRNHSWARAEASSRDSTEHSTHDRVSAKARRWSVLSGFSFRSAKRTAPTAFGRLHLWHWPSSTTKSRRASTWTLRLPASESARRASLPSFRDQRVGSVASAISQISHTLFPPVDEEKAKRFAEKLDIDEGVPIEHDDQSPTNPARSLSKRELLHQRLMFGSVVFAFNATCIILSALRFSGTWVLVMIMFFKSKDFLSVWIQIICLLYKKARSYFVQPKEQKASWILSLIPAYSESEEQIVKALFSLRDNGTGKHRQVMCIILDGTPRDIKSHMTRVVAFFEWQYVSTKWKFGVLKIDAGFVDDIPTLCIEKAPNAGKKDTLILCHDLFNHPRSNLDIRVRRLRAELWANILPPLTGEPGFSAFDLVFCTDADSTIHQGALARLANACLADPQCIAACGFVFVEFEPGFEWSYFNLYQAFQYSFGQIVRRGAEHFLGKVTCLPGCITMIVVRPEMAGATEKYAAPVTTYPVLRHQVQYLGTDRRLTYSMLSQGKHLHTLFIPEAGSETVAPQSLKHYLSQRRRWGSNAYFNNYWYLGRERMIPITRVFAAVEIARLSMVYYRVFNTALFLYGIANNFSLIALLPMLLVSFTPSFWFAFCVCCMNDHLKRCWVKLVCGFGINRCMSAFMSITVFTLVAKNLGSQVWGISGVTASTATAVPAAAVVKEEKDGSTEVDRAADVDV